jgi:Ca2+-binding EF-hand superfamily protein
LESQAKAVELQHHVDQLTGQLQVAHAEVQELSAEHQNSLAIHNDAKRQLVFALTLMSDGLSGDSSEREQQLAFLRAVFDTIDADGSGEITTEELQDAMLRDTTVAELFSGMASRLAPEGSGDPIDFLVHQLDTSGDGTISWDELRQAFENFSARADAAGPSRDEEEQQAQGGTGGRQSKGANAARALGKIQVRLKKLRAGMAEEETEGGGGGGGGGLGATPVEQQQGRVMQRGLHAARGGTSLHSLQSPAPAHALVSGEVSAHHERKVNRLFLSP